MFRGCTQPSDTLTLNSTTENGTTTGAVAKRWHCASSKKYICHVPGLSNLKEVLHLEREGVGRPGLLHGRLWAYSSAVVGSGRELDTSLATALITSSRGQFRDNHGQNTYLNFPILPRNTVVGKSGTITSIFICYRWAGGQQLVIAACGTASGKRWRSHGRQPQVLWFVCKTPM